ncbi:hypothetical protein CRG98_018453 [Punica granatum]|uniref:Tf2-1-like SH3-like domain-containing protein n=1 Tax=Punica granatum TaxID=22663 RepID=A0A2I0JZ93_PUNGR|nr:hypothetical protein CRG98_018453 [Punica granatum]
MLRACVTEFQGSWDDYLPLMKFAYNNSYQSSIRIASYESLYGQACQTPLCWNEVGERQLIGLEIVDLTSENVNVIRERSKTVQGRQKNYADKRRKDLEFQEGDRVFLKVSPWKGIMRFDKKGKLSPRYIGPYEILERIGNVLWRSHSREEATWEPDDSMRVKYPYLFSDIR